MIDYVMPITKENLEVLHNMGFILSGGCKAFITGEGGGYQIVFLSYIAEPTTRIVNMDSDEGVLVKTITFETAASIVLLANLGLTTKEIREQLKEIP